MGDGCHVLILGRAPARLSFFSQGKTIMTTADIPGLAVLITFVVATVILVWP